MLIVIPSLILLAIAIAITYAIKAIDRGGPKEKKVIKEKQLFNKKEVECCQ